MIDYNNKKVFICFLILLMSSVYASDSSAGKIISFSGEIWVDAFGNNSFIRVIKNGELLYKSTIIKTGVNSSAVIEVLKSLKEIPGSSVVSISAILNLETKKQKWRWFDSLIGSIEETTSVLFSNDKTIDLISRGNNYSPSTGLLNNLFAYEDTEDEKPGGSAKINTIKTAATVPGELEFSKGIFYFRKALYQESLNLFTLSLQAIEKSREVVPFKDSLYMFTGLCLYIIEEYNKAIVYLQAIVDKKISSEYDPFVSWALSDSYYIIGKQAEANIYADKTMRILRDAKLKQEFESYRNIK